MNTWDFLEILKHKKFVNLFWHWNHLKWKEKVILSKKVLPKSQDLQKISNEAFEAPQVGLDDPGLYKL